MRRLVAVLLATLPLVIVGGSFLSSARLFGGHYVAIGYPLFAIGGIVSCLNIYLSFLRGRLSRRSIGTEKVRNISGVPLIGMLALPGLWLLPPSFFLSCAASLLLALDTGSLHWFVIATWRDDCLWKS